ncbi:TetR/AcrR family transcriptional regulator [Streptomonospora wellingtoniae]|uniref:Helix-turn-helix domain-containing protein n=1 Tax=Streptomonospora wellingtoniae TaxID=3075544 RepID=A0ABU2KS84_9ACTN|nr:helix-turn-helix domain-containing protein [Streptomonospora sp. DSM 45055]MDT0302151.1 helix-turn-helix domain-containing protein [Streptomonospora sp. DSM 45055]
MPEPDRTASALQPADADHDARAERILDSAAELLVAWGYRRITIEDVAKRAGVGKGTVYLHFHTKELLFLTVLLRVQATLMDGLIASFRRDPQLIRPSALARANYTAATESPILRATLTRDNETLGSLVSSGLRELGDYTQVRVAVVTEYFAALREHGVLRTDAPLELQLHAFVRIFYGYMVTERAAEFMRADAGDHTDADARMLAHVVAASLEVPGDDPAPARAAAPRVIPLFERLLARVREEIANQKRT